MGVALAGGGVAADRAPEFDYAAAALQGDLSMAERALSDSNRAADRDRLEKFRARFADRTDGLALDAIGDPAVREIAGAYQDYWRDVLLHPDLSHALEVALIGRVREIIAGHDPGGAQVFLSDAELQRFGEQPETSWRDRGWATVRLAHWIEKRGYRCLTGRTAPHLELMLWRRSRSRTERVELTDGVRQIPVTFVHDVLVGGWNHFASLDGGRSTGWANRDGLFVVTEAHDDLTGPDFQVSFLKHEARHYADEGQYPNLSAADLEYRAKLTELVYAGPIARDILAKFARDRAPVDVPHPLASWHVMNDVAHELFGRDVPETWWERADAGRVAAAARGLLDRNDAILTAAGAATTSGVLDPPR